MNYFEIDAVNFSTLKCMDKSPAHYRHAVDNERKDTPSLLRGRAVHTAVLEPEKFDTAYAVFPGAIRRGKEWDAFKAAHPDEEGILKQKERDQVLAIAAAIRGHELAGKLLERGESEQVITWTDPATGVLCKARLDRVGDALLELKTTTDVHDRRFGALAARMKYHAQCAFYFDGLRYARGLERPVKIIAGEVNAPYDVAVFSLSDDDLVAGRETYQAWLTRLVECRQSGRWPGRYVEEQRLSLPVYVFEDDDQEDGTAVVLQEEAA